MGFDRFRFFYSKHQLPFPLDDTQVYVVSSDHMIIVAFRGTEPSKIYDWLSDANTPVFPGPARKGLVHLGFHQALASIYSEVRDEITQVRTNDQTLWFTGHSLGGALAMLAAARMYFEDPKLLADGIYRLASHARAIAYLRARTTRLSSPASSGSSTTMTSSHKRPQSPFFHHVNTMMYFDANGKLHEKAFFASTLMDRFKGFTADMFAPGTDGIRDHSMNRYLENLEKNLG